MQDTIDADELERWLEAEITEMREIGCREEANEASYILSHIRKIRIKES